MKSYGARTVLFQEALAPLERRYANSPRKLQRLAWFKQCVTEERDPLGGELLHPIISRRYVLEEKKLADNPEVLREATPIGRYALRIALQLARGECGEVLQAIRERRARAMVLPGIGAMVGLAAIAIGLYETGFPVVGFVVLIGSLLMFGWTLHQFVQSGIFGALAGAWKEQVSDAMERIDRS